MCRGGNSLAMPCARMQCGALTLTEEEKTLLLRILENKCEEHHVRRWWLGRTGVLVSLFWLLRCRRVLSWVRTGVLFPLHASPIHLISPMVGKAGPHRLLR